MSDPSGGILWLTGRPASGKTTIARALQATLARGERPALLLDSDALRPILTPRPTYTDSERDTFYGALGGLALLFAEQGATVLVAATASRRRWRDATRREAELRALPFVEIYLDCPLEVARSRDPKGLYARSASGEITALPGIGAPYEPPTTPDLVIATDRTPVPTAVTTILDRVPWLTPARECW